MAPKPKPRYVLIVFLKDCVNTIPMALQSTTINAQYAKTALTLNN